MLRITIHLDPDTMSLAAHRQLLARAQRTVYSALHAHEMPFGSYDVTIVDRTGDTASTVRLTNRGPFETT